MWIILPVKDLRRSKTRLARWLSPRQRSDLMRAMVEDVLEELARASKVSGVLVVSTDRSLHKIADQYGARSTAFDDDRSLNQAVGAACEQLARQGQTSCMIVHGDMPFLSGERIDRLIAQASRNQTILVPCKDRQGTNLLVLTLPAKFPFQYGRDSFRRHLQAARAAGLDPQIEADPDLALDVNGPACLAELRSRLTAGNGQQCARTFGFLQGLSLLQPHPHSRDRTGTPRSLGDEDALALSLETDTSTLMRRAAQIRDTHHGNLISYSRKVFIPLTRLCRDVCHYCTFATRPSNLKSPYLSVDEVLEIARAGSRQGCKEALFTLGEKPELRYRDAREALEAMGFGSTLKYVAHAAKAVHDDTGLLPHINAGCMTPDEIKMLRPVSASMGLMLESSSHRLCEKGMAHHGSPDKDPQKRLETIASAGELRVPFTSGILIGIGETRYERVEALLALRRLHRAHGHLQEIIIQNFRAKPGTKLAGADEPDLADLQWTIAVARLIFGPEMSIQAPPNLSPRAVPALIGAGINDWGGVSPVTPDFVNPEAPWPPIQQLSQQAAEAGKYLQQRLTVYPAYMRRHDQWIDPNMRAGIFRLADAEGYARQQDWYPGLSGAFPRATFEHAAKTRTGPPVSKSIRELLARLEAGGGGEIGETEIVELFRARGADFGAVCRAADRLRDRIKGGRVTYVVNRNINYTNICYFKCQFCAFSKGKRNEGLRGSPYNLSLDEIGLRTHEAWLRGATEVCLQGGIHPDFTGQTYVDICQAVRTAAPDIHIHAFSPLEVWQGAKTSGLSLERYLGRLKDVGLNTLPGTAAEILDDEVRASLCPDKINTDQWLEVMGTAHGLGLKTTATIMFGHIDRYHHWARHLLRIRHLQENTGGFTEFVPLPFVAQEAPMFLKGKSRRGPTSREAVLMHAIARLVLHPLISNIQVSWVKMGPEGASACLQAGANDLGGTLMNESITRAAGGAHGQQLSAHEMDNLIRQIGRQPVQRTTLYGIPSPRNGDQRALDAPLSVGAI